MTRDGNLMNIKWLCEIAGVSRSGCYRWMDAEKTRAGKEDADRAGFDLILRAYKHRGYDKGARGIYMRLLHQGTMMNIKKIRRLMHKYSFSIIPELYGGLPHSLSSAFLKSSAIRSNVSTNASITRTILSTPM